MKHTEKFLRQRKFYMALPLLTMPFITMIFWALGGGQPSPATAHETQHVGLNLNLPDAYFSKATERWDKFSLYEQAKHDAMKYEEARRNDPYYEVITLKDSIHEDSFSEGNAPTAKLITSLGNKNQRNNLEYNEALLNEKIELLTHEISKPQATWQTNETPPQNNEEPPASSMNTEIDRLEKMMQVMANTETSDPEMMQIESVLEKILDVQHPERINDKLKTQTLTQTQQAAFSVKVAEPDNPMDIIETEPELPLMESPDNARETSYYSDHTAIVNSFYGLNDESQPAFTNGNAIEAIIHDTQTLVSGATIKMRLKSPVDVSGVRIEQDQFIYGTCTINGERLSIEVNAIRQNNTLLPVALTAFDLDGIEGIYIPGAITRDVVKQSASQSAQDIQLSMLDNSFVAQAASAGLETAKGLFTRKTKLVNVTVKAGYQILLKDKNQFNP